MFSATSFVMLFVTASSATPEDQNWSEGSLHNYVLDLCSLTLCCQVLPGVGVNGDGGGGWSEFRVLFDIDPEN